MSEGKLNGLDLFSGIGGLTIALDPWVRPIAYCEKDQPARNELLHAMARQDIPIAPIWDSVESLCGSDLPKVDIIYGGFPCQDISVAGNRAGLDGKRSGLFWEVIRLTEECAPIFVFLENVWPGMSRHVEAVTAAFEELGFVCRDGNLAASDVGAWHKRERWFVLAAHPDREGQLQQEGPVREIGRRLDYCFEESWLQDADYGVSLLVHGTPAELAEQKLLGNGVVPRQAREAFKRLMGLK